MNSLGTLSKDFVRRRKRMRLTLHYAWFANNVEVNEDPESLLIPLASMSEPSLIIAETSEAPSELPCEIASWITVSAKSCENFARLALDTNARSISSAAMLFFPSFCFTSNSVNASLETNSDVLMCHV